MERNHRGRFINLNDSKARRYEIEENLQKLNIINRYSRFEAIKGDPAEAKARNITTGELGLWQSWLNLLNEEKHKAIFDDAVKDLK